MHEWALNVAYQALWSQPVGYPAEPPGARDGLVLRFGQKGRRQQPQISFVTQTTTLFKAATTCEIWSKVLTSKSLTSK